MLHRMTMIASVLLLAMAVAAPASAEPYPPGATVTCDASVVAPGGQVQCTGAGFEPGASVAVAAVATCDGGGGFTVEESVTADGAGDVATTLAMEDADPDCTVEVTFSGDDAQSDQERVAVAELTLTAAGDGGDSTGGGGLLPLIIGVVVLLLLLGGGLVWWNRNRSTV